MKKRAPTLIALAVLASLAAWVGFNETKPKEDEGKVHIWREKTENLVAFELKDVAHGVAVACAKGKDGVWRVTAPAELECDADAADLVVKHLADPGIERQLEPQADLTPFGLQPPQWRASFKLKNGKGHSLLLGLKNPTDSGYFFMEEGGKALYTIATWSADNFRKTMTDLRSRQLVAIDPAKITRLVIRRRKVPTIEAVRAGDGWQLTQPLAAAADKYAIEAILNDLKALKGQDVIDEPAAYSRYKLDQPTVEAVLYSGTGSGQTLTLARPDPAKDEAYASSSRLPFVFRLANAQALANLTKAPGEFRERLLLSATKEDLTGIGITAGSLTVAATKGRDGKWQITTPAGAAAEQELNDMMFEIIYVRVENFTTDKPGGLAGFGLAPPHADVTLKGVKDKTPFTAHYLLGSRAGDHAYLKFLDRPSVYEVRHDLLDKVERFMDKVRSGGKPVTPAASGAPATPKPAAPTSAPAKKP